MRLFLSGREIPDKHICYGLQVLSRIDRILVFLSDPQRTVELVLTEGLVPPG